jgi:hypothetical protein
MTDPQLRLSDDYTPAFLVYLNHPDEETLHTAYELGRAALANGISLLELVRIHHTVIGKILRATPDPEGVQPVVDAAAGFLVEALAPYEMARRGFLERANPRPPDIGHTEPDARRGS